MSNQIKQSLQNLGEYLSMPEKKTTIDFKDTAVAITKGGRFMAQPFKFLDGQDGSIVIIKKTGRRNWQPNIKSVIIQYDEDNTSTD